MAQDSAEVERAQWRDTLERLSRDHESDELSIEVLDETYGDNQEVEWLPLSYLTYDDKDDVVMVAVGGHDRRFPVVLRHVIEHPTHLEVAPVSEDVPVGLRITARAGVVTIVSIRHRRTR